MNIFWKYKLRIFRYLQNQNVFVFICVSPISSSLRKMSNMPIYGMKSTLKFWEYSELIVASTFFFSTIFQYFKSCYFIFILRQNILIFCQLSRFLFHYIIRSMTWHAKSISNFNDIEEEILSENDFPKQIHFTI